MIRIKTIYQRDKIQKGTQKLKMKNQNKMVKREIKDIMLNKWDEDFVNNID